MQPTPVFSLVLTSEPGDSSPSSYPPWWVSRQASQAGEYWSAPILCAGIFPLCPLHHCSCTLLCGSKASSPPPPPSLPVKGLPSVWKLFILHISLPEVQVQSLFFCLCFFLFSFALPRYMGSFLTFGMSECWSFASIQ